jgi:hypothetical protein
MTYARNGMTDMRLRFICPTTNKPFEKKEKTDTKSLARRWSQDIVIACPHCNTDHNFLFSEAYLANTLDNVSKTHGSKDENTSA